ncbi:MAG: trigger factor [Actinomycetota bacterium]|nr:trigger factor [Actinomycetota bacterium]
MKSVVEPLSPTRVRLSVEVPFDEIGPSLKAAYQRIGAQVNVPGFRKGKVPNRVIDQRFGRGVVLEEAVNDYLPQAYTAAVTESGVKALGQPKVDVTDFADGEDLKFTAEVDIRPEITLPDFSTLQVTVDDAVVADADINEQLEALQARFASLKPVERAAEAGDFVAIDLAATHDDEPVEDLSATGLSYEVGTGSLLENLDDAVVGLSAGDTAAFSTTPTGGPLEGEVVDVSVTVTAVRERELPPVDDDFAQLVSEFDTLDELREALRSEIEPRKKVEQLVAARDAVLEALLDAVDVPLPEGVVSDAVDSHFEDGHGDPAHRDEYVKQVQDTITRDLVLDSIADRDDVEIGQAELTEFLVRQSAQYGMTPEQFAQALAQSGQVGSVVGEVRRAKALSLVLEAATVVDASGSPVDMSGPPAPEAPDAEESAADPVEQGADPAEAAAADEAPAP